jgi:hypothetical protein
MSQVADYQNAQKRGIVERSSKLVDGPGFMPAETIWLEK